MRRGDASLGRLVASAQTFEDFRSNQRRVRVLGVTTLGLLTLMLLFAATWSAIHLARGIGTPIRALAEAAQEVAAGNLTHRVEAITDDELAVLADAFNDMTAQLAENRARLEANAAELREKNLALEERRHYIETVLQTVSTGVISLDEENRVTTINAAALAMLRLEQPPAPCDAARGGRERRTTSTCSNASSSARAHAAAPPSRWSWRAPRQDANGESHERSAGPRNGAGGRCASSRCAHGDGARAARGWRAARRRPRHRRPVGAARGAARGRMERGRASARA